MAGQLQVHADHVFATSHAVSNDAEELRDELERIARDWDNLSRSWSGKAATAYASIWNEWRTGATRLVDALAESSDKLGRAAVAYADQDASASETLESVPINVSL